MKQEENLNEILQKIYYLIPKDDLEKGIVEYPKEQFPAFNKLIGENVIRVDINGNSGGWFMGFTGVQHIAYFNKVNNEYVLKPNLIKLAIENYSR